jgi:hypothetical protein
MLRKPVLIGITWIAATAICVVFSVATKMGPVVISVTRRHGIHLGDLIAFGLCYAVAIFVTYTIVRSRL